MDKLNTYIDRCIIQEYATKSLTDGFSLDVESIPANEMSHLIERLINSDSEIKEILLDHVQKLINARIPYVEADSMYDLRNSGRAA